MKKLIVICMGILLVSCGSTTKIVGSWTNKEKLAPQPHGSVFILAMTNNTQAKNVMEEEMAFQANKRGISATKSKDIFIQKFTKEDMPSKEYLLKEIKATGAKTIFTVTLQDKETTTRYHPGSEMYVGGYSPYMYDYYNSFYGYYNYSFPITYTPGYYDTTKTFYLETNLYNVETEELIWSAQSKTYDPADTEDFIKSYSEAIIHQMIEDGVLKGE